MNQVTLPGAATRLSRRLALSLPAVAAAAPALAQGAAPGEAEAARIAADAYVFGYPLVTMEMTRRISTNVPNATAQVGRAPMGQFHMSRTYPTAAFRDVTAPNADTLYCTAWLDLGAEPWVVSWPEMTDRYYLMPMLDGWTNVIAAAGSRTTGNQAQTYVIAGPKFRGATPPGIPVIRSPTDMMWILGRVYCTGTPEDYAAVHAIQDRMRLQPLSSWGQPFTPPAGRVDPAIDMRTGVRDQVDRLNGTDYFRMLATLMAANPPAAADAPIVARMARIGLVPGRAFDPTRAPQAVRRAIDGAPRAGQAAIIGRIRSSEARARQTNNWFVITQTGNYGTDYLNRAYVTAVGLGANRPNDAVYPFTEVDATGQKLTGANRYRLRFAAGQRPPARGFWSLTMYNSDFFFVDNPLNRYTLSSRNALVSNPDGTTDLLIQADDPGADRQANWLPAPRDGFVLMFRLYWPMEAPAFSV
ncbi:MAG TPA: DUF1254 domain-containing protein, partial [Roseomonas sp.]|nr:DUF1254 domain-containing protein [Roseomonas sp.]